MFEEISGKLSKITKDVTYSTEQQLDIMKLKSYVKRNESIIEDAYKEIGKLYFNQNELEMPGEFAEYVDAVREAKSKISELQASADTDNKEKQEDLVKAEIVYE